MRRIAGLALMLGGCILGEFVVESEPPDPTGAGGSGGASATSAGGDDACGLATWPEKRAGGSSGVGDIDFVVATRRLDFGETSLDPDGPTVGYDLDGRCTCAGDEERSCARPDFAGSDDCDGPGGRDNNAARIVNAAKLIPGLSSADLTDGIEEGAWSILIVVRGYNGEANDDRVAVSIHPSPGFRFDFCNDTGDQPSWDGQDRWPIHAFSVRDGSGGGGGGGSCTAGEDPTQLQPVNVDENGYVADGTLVASLPIELALSGGDVPASINLTAGVLSAVIDTTVDPPSLTDGLIVGRWPSKDVLAALSAFNGGNLCTTDTIYTALKNAVCSFVDIAAIPTPTAVCDAVSFAVGFEAAPARLGEVYAATGTPTPCPPGEDPADDSCDTLGQSSD